MLKIEVRSKLPAVGFRDTLSAMGKTVLVIAALIFVTSTTVLGQTPSSPTSNTPVGTQVTPASIEVQLDELQALEAYAEQQLVEFDASYDPSSPLQESDAYAKLWAARILREQRQDHVAELLGEVSEKAASSVERRVISSLNNRRRMGEAPSLARLAEHALASMTQVQPLVAPAPPTTNNMSDRMQSALSKLIFPSFEEESSFRRANQRMNAMANARAIKNSATLLADVEALAKDIRAGWSESTETVKKDGDAKKRRPAAAKYGPSTGPNGNLIGREFPANMWAITYDDGPAQQTASILDALKKRGLKATFFWLSKNAPAYAGNSIARAKQEGHELANHSATHAQLTKVSSSQLDKEIFGSTNSLEAIYGQKIRFFRLPYGSGVKVPEIRSRLEQAGLVHVYWNVDTLDWQDRNPDTLYARTMKQVRAQGRGIILFHDIHNQTVAASPRVMDELIAQKSRVVTLGEALEVLNGVRP